MTSICIEESYQELKDKIGYFPVDDYISSGISEVGTYPENDPEEIFNQLHKYQPTPIWRIKKASKTFYTPIPILVKIYQEEDLFFAENENLVVCGTGQTPQDALEDLGMHIIHFFEYYKNIPEEKLMGEALRLKKLYKNLLIEKDAD